MDGDVPGDHAELLEDMLIAETDLVVLGVGGIALLLSFMGGGDDCNTGTLGYAPVIHAASRHRLPASHSSSQIIKEKRVLIGLAPDHEQSQALRRNHQCDQEREKGFVGHKHRLYCEGGEGRGA